ncbi:MAG TPA: DUF58 domain-containing protein [Tepidiformaceae bacterium]|nr:DUF58 domain-containing protein [Tepidiformaceae bacterium]
MPALLRRFHRRTADSTPGNDRATRGDIPPELLQRVRYIELKARRLVDQLFLGEYHAVFRGQGVEFDELRPYTPGDDVRSIDWKTFARTGKPHIRRYREDRDLTVLLVVDVSASQFAGAQERSKADLAAELCAVIALAAIRNKDRVGLLLFADGPERYIRPDGGRLHVLRVVREILWAHPRTSGTSIESALEYLSGVQKRRATVFLVSDFLATGYAPQLRAAARRHDIIAIRVREPVDEAIPNAGIVRVADAETREARYVDTGDRRVRDAYAARVRLMDDDRRRLFGEAGVDEIPVMVGLDYVPALLQFFRRRTRKSGMTA